MPKTSTHSNEPARAALVALLESIHAKSPYAGEKMSQLSKAVNRSENVYRGFKVGAQRLDPGTLSLICAEIRATPRETLAAKLLLVACKWGDEDIAQLMIRLASKQAKIPLARGAPKATPPGEALKRRRRAAS